MGFINWGSENPEHLAERRRLEEEAIYEQAVRMARMRGNATQTAGAVGGGRKSGFGATMTSQLVVSNGFSNSETGPNWQFHVLDYDNNVINGPIDSGINWIEYSTVENNYVIYNSGYAYYFKDPLDNSKYAVVFLDAAGNIIKTITGSTVDFSITYSRGLWIYAEDYDAKTLWIFSGDKVTEIVNGILDVDYWDVGSDSVDSTRTGALGLFTAKQGEDTKWTNTYYLIDPVTHVATPTVSEIRDNYFDYSAIEDNYILYSFSANITRETYNFETGLYETIDIYDQSGTLLNHFDAGALADYDTREYYQYGNEQMLWIFHNNSDSGIDYLLVNYNGQTNTFVTTTHARGTDYPDFNVSRDYIYSGNQFNFDVSNNIEVAFYNSTGYSDNLTEVDGCDFVIFFDGCEAATLIAFDAPGSGASRRIAIDSIWAPNSFFHVCDDGDGNLTVFVTNTFGGIYIFGGPAFNDIGWDTASIGPWILLKTWDTTSNAGVYYALYDSFSTAIPSAAINEPGWNPASNYYNWDYTTLLVRQEDQDVEFRLNSSTLVWEETTLYPNREFGTSYRTGYDWNTLTSPGVIVEWKNEDRLFWINDKIQEGGPGNPAVPNTIISGGKDLFDTGNIITTNRTLVSPGTPLVVGKVYGVQIAGALGNIQNPWVGGTGYTATLNVEPTGGHGTGYSIDTNVNGLGVIESYATNSNGDGYCVGDILTVPGGNGDAYFVITELDNTTIDDFSNVGYNHPGTTNNGALAFVASGTEPNTWTHGSIVNEIVPYTHTQMSGWDSDAEAIFADYEKDGAVVAGTSANFGASSSYFTNLYPGLFVLCVDSPDITDFTISGNLGSEEATSSTTNTSTITNDDGDGASYTYYSFQSRDTTNSDASLNQVIIVDAGSVDDYGTSEDAEQYYQFIGHPGGLSTARLHYLMWSKDDGQISGSSQIEMVVREYLKYAAPASPLSLAEVLTTLNTNYNKVTGKLPSHTKASRLRNWTLDNVYTFLVPQFDDIRVGHNRIIISYEDPDRDFQLSARVYTLDGLNQIKVDGGYSIDTNIEVVDTRAFFKTGIKVDDGSLYFANQVYAITLNDGPGTGGKVSTKLIKTPPLNNQIEWTFNDFTWWWD